MPHNQQNSIQRAEIRKKLLDSGYTPLPAHQKGVYILGWSTANITPEWLEKYARSADFLNTGIRCDNLIAFDLDVVDDDLIFDIDECITSVIGETTPLCRHGSPPKYLLVYRLKGEPGRSARTGLYGEHRVELLCGKGRQFIAYGQHPSGIPYAWDDLEPLDVPWDQLPACTHKQAVEALEACEQRLIATKLPKVKNAYARQMHNEAAGDLYDLTDDFPILLQDGDETTWGELKDSLDEHGVKGNIQREDGEFGDSDGVHFMIAKGGKEPCAHDFVRDITHWEPLPMEQLAEALPEPPKGEMQAGIFKPDPYEVFRSEWVLVGQNSTVRHVDDRQRSYAVQDLRHMTQHIRTISSISGKPVAAINRWLQDPEKYRAHYAAMLPNTQDMLVNRGRIAVFNTYVAPKHPKEGGEVDTCMEFVEHLIPRDDERQLFWDWHATKLVHPEYRMHGLIMVADSIYGVGRGTWTQILQRLFGPQYVREITLGDLVGTGSQSSYNDYLADSLMISVPEALEEREDSHGWAARHVAYERIKLAVEPDAQEKYIKRKYARNTVETVYSSLLIATNHVDALAIERGDRRLIVLDNGSTKLTDAPKELFKRIHAWKNEAANIGALERALRAHYERCEYDPFGDPPMTPAKERMIEIGKGSIDQAYEYMLENAPGDLVTHKQWLMWAYKARDELDLEWPLGPKADQAMAKMLQRRAWHVRTLPKSGQLWVQGKAVRPWIIRNKMKWESHTQPRILAAEIEKNGDPQGTNVQNLRGE